jgi:hypothetical protein
LDRSLWGGEGQAGGATKGDSGKRGTEHNHTAEVRTKPSPLGCKVIMDLVIRIVVTRQLGQVRKDSKPDCSAWKGQP